MRNICLAALAVILMVSCDSRDRVLSLAESDVRNHTECQGEPEILGVSEPDSAFGLNYFTKQEQAYMLGTVTNVTKVLMERTEYMTKPDLDDAYTMTLADLEMRMSTGLFSGMLGDCKKGAWSGWKVRVTYICKSKYGCMYKAQRWYFLDKDCQTVIRSFDLPIVETSKADKTTKSATKKKQGNTASKIMLSTGK
jgi:hypothetical protein